MGGSVRSRCGRWVKLLALLSLLVPLALRAGSLLSHAPPPSSQPAAFITAAAVSVSGSAHGEAGHRQGQRRRRTEDGSALPSAGLSARTTTRFTHGGGQAGFGDESKRMAPSGSNPLHNLRRR